MEQDGGDRSHDQSGGRDTGTEIWLSPRLVVNRVRNFARTDGRDDALFRFACGCSRCDSQIIIGIPTHARHIGTRSRSID